MQSSLENIKLKIRALTEDFLKSDVEVFTYTNSNIFTLSEEHVNTVLKVLKNNIELGSGEYAYDSDTNKITISMPSGNELENGDIIEVDYNFYKYSEDELSAYVKGAIVWISIFSHDDNDIEIEDDEIYPTIDNKTSDLVALIASILINPDYTSYKLPNLTVTYYQKLSKEDKIEKLIKKFNYSVGIIGVIEFDAQE